MTLGYDELASVARGVRLPAVLVDLDAFDRNLERHLQLVRRSGLTLRFATKSIRVTALLRRVLARPGARGLMCFSVNEARCLADAGFDDLFVAYPPFARADLETLAELTARGVLVSAAVDSSEALARFSAVAAERGVQLRVVLCVDMSLRRAGLHVGVRRSPLHDVEEVLALAERARALRSVVLHGVLGYEAQVAGLGDDSPFDPPAVRLGKRLLRRASMGELGARRAAIASRLRARGFDLAFVNGGGTGSLDVTLPATGVSEVSAGSGLYKPLLFDAYRSSFVKSLEPACFFALEVTRRPARRMVTCLGGGYVASGAPGPDRLPRAHAPAALTLLPMEGAGEVQTPLTGDAADGLELGAPVFFRHAKAGELMERFAEVLLVQGGRVVERAPTYRGQGWCFL